MKILVCDSDAGIRESLRKELERIRGEDTVVYCRSIFEMVTYLYDEAKGDADLICLNTWVEEDGILAAKMIQDFYPHIQIIFFSGKPVDAQDLFQLKPTYFLKLPFQESVFREAIRRAREQADRQKGQVLVLRQRGNLIKIPYTTINYMESLGRKLILYADERQWEINMTMEEILGKVPENFLQCHRSYIVNLDKIVQYRNQELVLTGRQRIPIAKRRVAELKKMLHSIM